MPESPFRQGPWRVALMALALCLLLASSSFAQDQNPQQVVTKGLFVERFFINEETRPLTARPYVPDGIEKLPPERRYDAVVEQLRTRGVDVLVGTKPNDPLTVDEYLSLTHILAGGEPGKPMADQLNLLKSKRALDPNQIGVVRAFQGSVLITRGEKSHQVKSAEPVLFKDMDETEFEAKLELLFDDGSTLSIGEDTVVKIDEMVYDPNTKRRSVSLRLAAGIIRVKAAKNENPESKFEVRTPTMVAGVRGTEFFVLSRCNRSQLPPDIPLIDMWERLKDLCRGQVFVSEGSLGLSRDKQPGQSVVVNAGTKFTEQEGVAPINPGETATLAVATNVPPQPILLGDANQFIQTAAGLALPQPQGTEGGQEDTGLTTASVNFPTGRADSAEFVGSARPLTDLTPVTQSEITP